MFKTAYAFGVHVTTKTGLYRRRIALYSTIISRFLDDTSVVADLGSGLGEITLELCKHSLYVVALDIDSRRLKNSAAFAKSNFGAVVGDAERMPLRTHSLNLVASTSLIEHLTNPHAHLLECRRVIRDDGYLVIQIPNLQYFVEPHTKMPMFFFPGRLRNKIVTMLGYAWINWDVTMKRLMTWLRSSEFKVLFRLKIYHGPRTPPWPAGWILVCGTKHCAGESSVRL